MIPEKFDEIRPYNDDEVQGAIESLLADRQFNHVLKSALPFLPAGMRRGLLRLILRGVDSTLGFQVRVMKSVVRLVLWRCSRGATLTGSPLPSREGRYTFISNHRDIVLDSAILDVLIHNAGYPTTCEIAIGDNLLIYPWIRTLVRLNKAFTVRRSLSPRELFKSSKLMSEYIHYAVTEKRENIWIAQREGRAKDSNDRTQDSVLKMLAMGAADEVKNPADRLRDLNIVPLTISYEYDPCDYLKAMEFQLKRDDPSWKKSRKDDLDNMKTGILGQKGHIHYHMSPCINEWIDEYAELPAAEFFSAVAKRMDSYIHQGYHLFPCNYIADDMLSGSRRHQEHYTPKDEQRFLQYLQQRLDMIDIPGKDEDFLRERILTMYANPLRNKLVTTN